MDGEKAERRGAAPPELELGAAEGESGRMRSMLVEEEEVEEEEEEEDVEEAEAVVGPEAEADAEEERGSGALALGGRRVGESTAAAAEGGAERRMEVLVRGEPLKKAVGEEGAASVAALPRDSCGLPMRASPSDPPPSLAPAHRTQRHIVSTRTRLEGARTATDRRGGRAGPGSGYTTE